MGSMTRNEGDPIITQEVRKTGSGLWRSTLILGVALGLAGCTATTKASRQKRQTAFEAKRKKRPPMAKRRNARPLRRTLKRIHLDELAQELEAVPRVIERPCANTLCTRRVMDKLFGRLDVLDTKRTGQVRIIQLGDSHIAADYITRTIRDALQDRFGDAGRGLVPIGQKARYGGRALKRTGWTRQRIVDDGQAGLPFGTTGMVIVSARGRAEATFKLRAEDDMVGVHYLAHPQGSAFTVFADGEPLETIQTRSDVIETREIEVPIPMHAMGGVVPPKVLTLTSAGPGVKLFGVSFETEQPGLIYDSIGPVGADAAVYLTFEQNSLRGSLRAIDPHLVVLMVGGNDALAVRKAVRSLDEVRQQHVDLLEALKQHAPEAECLVWAPMDAGERVDGKVVSKRYIQEIRDIQRETALEMGCAFWDTYESMGGRDSFGRWLERGIMNQDLVHPRAKGGDLMGHLFARALMNAYLGLDGSNQSQASLQEPRRPVQSTQ